MTLEKLLEFWADWRRGRRCKSYFAASRLNLLMAGGVPTGRAYASALPYGIDPDSAGAAVDVEVCRLPPMQQKVIFAEFCSEGSQEWKAANIRIGRKRGISANAYKSNLSQAKRRLAAQPALLKLLKNA